MIPVPTLIAVTLVVTPAEASQFEGRFFSGAGDVEYLQLLDISRRMFEPDPEFQNLPMLYTPAWNGLVEGPTWDAWWIQNSYGTTYCALPFWTEPYTTFIQNSQDLWFDQMGDGRRKGEHDWVAPDGCLCDAASPGRVIYKQGDGRIDIHDWGMEFTAAGIVMQAELLLISRDRAAIERYLPKLERSANFIETRRDPETNLFLAGPAGNLLAPSYAGYRKPDGSYSMAYLSGLSITYIAALDRLIELETMAGRHEQAELYTRRRDLARQGLPRLVTDEGYFVKYIDPDGTKHGVYGAPEHGYFEAVCNHDAICFNVVDDAQARRIYDKIASIPGLRPYGLIITNYPALDDMYQEQTSIWKFGHWVNGGHWSTCEARMIMAYYRLGQFGDARRSMKKMLDYARRFRMDNPLIDFGNDVYQPHVPINCVYDNWGVPAAMIRGLYQYAYTADGLKLVPQIPPSITRIEQKFPIRFGPRRLYIRTVGTGNITAVRMNGQAWDRFDGNSVFLPDDARTPNLVRVEIFRGGATPGPAWNSETADDARVPVASLEEFTSAEKGNGLPVRIGADSNGANRFVGQIHRVRVHARALSTAEIQTLAGNMNATLTGTALVGDWMAGAGKQEVLTNQAGGGLDANVVGQLETVAVKQDAARNALEFRGQGFLEIPDDPRLDLLDGFTLDAWICPGELPLGGGRIIDKCPAGTADGWTFDTFPRNDLRLITPYGTVTHQAGLVPGTWAHVAGSHDATDELRLYVNGKQVASARVQPRHQASLERISKLHERLVAAGLGETYEARHARLTLECAATAVRRSRMQEAGQLARLASEASQIAADRSYRETAIKLAAGLQKVLEGYGRSEDARKRQIHAIWELTEQPVRTGQP